jgi:MFS family permease
VAGLITAGTIASWPLTGVVSDWLGRRKPVYLTSQLAGMTASIAFALVVPGRGVTGAIAVAVLAGPLTGGFIVPFVMVTELFPSELAGTASGVANTTAP